MAVLAGGWRLHGVRKRRRSGGYGPARGAAGGRHARLDINFSLVWNSRMMPHLLSRLGGSVKEVTGNS